MKEYEDNPLLNWQIPEEGKKRQFAREQLRKLTEKSGLATKRAERIMRAAGPKWCVESVDWIRNVILIMHSAQDPTRRYLNIADQDLNWGMIDAIDCILSGAGGRNGFGKRRMERALQSLGIEPPNAPSGYALTAILRGAHAYVLSVDRATDPLSARNSINEPALCYVKDNVAYFTTQELGKQKGWDWDKAPYQIPSGLPYVPMANEPENWNKDGTPKWEIIKVSYEGPFQTPDLFRHDTPLSVYNINNRIAPWLRNVEKIHVAIMAGVSISKFIEIIESEGGKAVIIGTR